MAGANTGLIRIVTVVASFILIALMTVAAMSVHSANSLHIPVPFLLKALAPTLPIVELVAIFLSNVTIPRLTAKGETHASSLHQFKRRLLLGALAFFWVTTILDAGMMSSSTLLQDPDAMTCILERTWSAWFRQKNVRPVRAIQDSLECCGLRSTRDRAWPFPDLEHDAGACIAAYQRKVSCMKQWQHEAHSVLTSFVVIGAISLGLKILIFGLFWNRDVFALSKQPGRNSQRSGDPERRQLLDDDGAERFVEEADETNHGAVSTRAN